MILRQNTSDCVYDMSLESIGRLQTLIYMYPEEKVQEKKYEKYMEFKKAPENKSYFGGYNKNFIFKDGLEKLLKKYKECKKNKKILCVPIQVGEKAVHNNMLVFNFYSKTLERYEPHGNKIVKEGYDNEYFDKVCEKMVLYFNDNNEKMEYLAPNKTCPIKKNKELQNVYAGFQKDESIQKRILSITEKELIYKNILFEEGGYCVMWSFFVMDLRLKFPKLDPRLLYSTALKDLNKGSDGLIRFIRGFTNRFVDDLEKNLKDYKDIIFKSQKDLSSKLSKELLKKVQELLEL